MGIVNEAAAQAKIATKLYGREMGGIAKTAGKAEAAAIKQAADKAAYKVANAAIDTLALTTYVAVATKDAVVRGADKVAAGAVSAYGSAKGAALIGKDLTTRGLTRVGQFAEGAALTGKMELRFAGQDIAAAGRQAKAFVVADAKQTAADFAHAASVVDAAALRGAQHVQNGVVRVGRFAENTAINTAAAVVVAGQEIKFGAQLAKAEVKAATNEGRDIMGNKLITLGFKVHS